MTATTENQDVVRITLAVLFIVVLISACFSILRPFLTALVWATMIVVTTWSLMLRVQGRLGGKRWLAVTVMTLGLLLVFIIPFALAIVAIVGRADDVVALSKSLAARPLPPPPEWVERLPIVGGKVAARWHTFAAANQAELSERFAPYVKRVVGWLITQLGGLLMMVVQFLLTTIISAVLYAGGEQAAKGVCLFARKVGGKDGEAAAVLAAKAVRGIALGVVVTAIIQAILGAIGLTVAGVPAVGILTAVMFVLCVAQIGPGLVLFPSAGWLYWKDEPLWGTILLVWAFLVGIVDNFIRPFLIKKGADLPLVLIFAGVIGGLITFGVIGLFIGPVMLAVTFTLLKAWVLEGTDGGMEEAVQEADEPAVEAAPVVERGRHPL
ncbi:AI-2E family transporter YdiK [Geomonas sp. RF6]|uniref:AI-2E family transporter YdiK n=1 Tax=Geomonas sp. RF6 TaxID=2897342 RepID=UPI001E37445E|nr:AI-2E family transporter YdiK [Geomonas sp. RF6]UFS70652.1 AI-2E family transporter YdiK [Geomonas sp. RF6]